MADDVFGRRRRCLAKGCREARDEDRPFCGEHAAIVPEDLIYRVVWAYEEGSTLDRVAAIQAAHAYIADALR